MAKLDYVARETATNLRRNVSMASAALLTVTVSLALVGGALLVKQGVGRATVQWRGHVELSVYMKPEATAAETEAVRRQLAQAPEVSRFKYLDKAAAYAEFRRIFADEPTGNLDPNTSNGIMRLLDRINRTGTTVVMATHDSNLVDTMRRRVVELDRGVLVRDQARGVYGAFT